MARVLRVDFGHRQMAGSLRHTRDKNHKRIASIAKFPDAALLSENLKEHRNPTLNGLNEYFHSATDSLD